MGAFCVYPDEYRPRQPKSTPLFRLLDIHYEEFRNVYDERFSKRYGFLRPITDEVVEKYLRCGDSHFGFARIRCRECGAEYLRAFSCKCRGFLDLPGTSCFRLCWFLSILFEEEVVGSFSLYIPRKGAKQVIYYGAKPGSIAGTRCSRVLVIDSGSSQAWRGRKRRQCIS